MASDRQVSANRQNAVKSTGPITQNGKLQSRRNALRHGLTAATVVPAIEDRQEFEQFAAAVRADYQPTSTVEEELISRLTSLLWRLRRSTLIETILFQLQARLAQDQKEATQTGSDTTKPAIEVFYRLLRSPESFVHAQPIKYARAYKSQSRCPKCTREPLTQVHLAQSQLTQSCDNLLAAVQSKQLPD